MISKVELHLGDCLEILPALDKVDCVVTDPPYGLNIPYLSYKDTRENSIILIDLIMPKLLNLANRTIILPGITQVHLYPQPDWIFSITWNTTGSFGKYGYTQWMPMLVYGKDLKGFGNVNNGILKSDVIRINGGGGVGFQRGNEKKKHPCPKPENIMRHIIQRLTAPNDIVLDPFAGSGTTGVACVKANRNYIGIEIDKGYFEIAKKRIEQVQCQAVMDL